MSIKDIKKDEVRGFKISGDAISELLWELLNKSGDMLLDLPDNSDTIFHMHWDREKDELTFYALEFRDRIRSISKLSTGISMKTSVSQRIPFFCPKESLTEAFLSEKRANNHEKNPVYYKTLAPDASSGARVFCNCNYSTRPSRTLRS